MRLKLILKISSLALLTACADPNYSLKHNPEANSGKDPQAAGALIAHAEVPKANAKRVPDPVAEDHALALEAKATPARDFPPLLNEMFDTPEIKLRADETIWKKVAGDDGISTYEARVAQAGVVAFRGEMKIPAELKNVATVLSDPAVRKEWVDALLETRTVEFLNPFNRLEYNRTKVPWPFQERDFLYRVKVKVNPEPAEMLITMTSVEDPREPPHSGMIRGQILHSFYYLKQLGGAEPATQIVVEMAVDPKGVIPLWIVNLTQRRWPHHTLLALKRIALRPDLVVPKEIEEYFKHHIPGGKK